ncbi:sushi domain-containing protein 2-like [Saccostrea echinata]|uniref:sushi domain-containing protein 2-like n=1 Tax=Saccostrea echinata TaxID=191078 RepID=UPI002A806965|nr:sushi domain-containing protein 2-like [Saccostrea echinata]
MAAMYARVYLCLTGILFQVKGQVLFDYRNGNEVTLQSRPTPVLIPGGQKFPFFGQLYNAFYVSKDGIVGFSPDAEYVTGKVYSFDREKLANELEDYPFIATFLYGGVPLNTPFQNGNDIYGGKIYFQILLNSTSSRDIESMGRYINDAFIGVYNFTPSYALVITWVNVTDLYQISVAGCNDKLKKCQKNTFQAVLLSDGKKSFAIFNYQQTEITTNPSYQAGFNAGNGRGWSEAMPSSKLQNAAALQGSNITGRYLYKIDQERILTGGCNGQRELSPNGRLQVTPGFAGMLGGEMLEVSGPCLRREDRIFLRFGTESAYSECSMINTMKARCSVPMLLERGEVNVALSLDEKANFYYDTDITIVHPSRMPKETKVKLHDNGPGQRWNETYATTLALSWDPNLLSTDPNAIVDINFVGFIENKITFQAGWNKRITLNHRDVRVGERTFMFNATDVFCDAECARCEVGVVEVTLRDKSMAAERRVMFSGVVPMGWIVNTKMLSMYGSNWQHTKCVAWYNEDRKDMRWLENLEYCPCNLQLALADFGRWQTDVGCNLYSNDPHKCRFHLGAVHCVRAVQPTRQEGAGNQCCYGHNGQLRFAADTFQGSTPDRSHDWGAAPYVKPGFVPSLSHWIQDVVTFYYCCLWTDYQDCDYYMDQRGTRDCSGYSPPNQAMVFGQSNVRTFDGQKYHVCGEGDFVLLNSTDVKIVGRFQKSPFNPQNTKSVILTAVGVQARNEVVEIKLKGPEVDRSIRTLDVLVNGEFHYFDQGPQRWKDFKETAVVNSDDLSNTKESNFTIIVKNGVGIQVAEENDMLSLIVMIPPQFNSSGLLGSWNNNINDEFTPAKGGSLPMNASPTQIYEQFILSWAIERKSSFIPFPVFAKNISLCTPTSDQQPSCLSDSACNYDLWSTGNTTLAQRSLKFSQRFQELQTELKPVRSCGLLNVPRSIKDNYNYSLGSTVTIQSCRIGRFTGRSQYTCTDKGDGSQEWTPPITGSCQVASADEGLNEGAIAGIVIAVLLVILIVVVIAFVCFKRQRSSSNNKTTKRESDEMPAGKDILYKEDDDPRYSSAQPPMGQKKHISEESV